MISYWEILFCLVIPICSIRKYNYWRIFIRQNVLFLHKIIDSPNNMFDFCRNSNLYSSKTTGFANEIFKYIPSIFWSLWVALEPWNWFWAGPWDSPKTSENSWNIWILEYFIWEPMVFVSCWNFWRYVCY